MSIVGGPKPPKFKPLNGPGPSKKLADLLATCPRPPNDRGQGRKPLAEGVETVTVSLRMTPEQRAKLARLGGAAWVRARIDKAKA